MKDTTTIPYKIYLSEDELPRNWYNVRADMTNKPAPLLNPGPLQPMTAEELGHVFCDELVKQELDDTTAYIPIPQEIRDFYKMYRPSPLVRAYCLEEKLDTPAHTAQQLNTLRSTWLGDSRAQLDLWTGRQEGAPCHAKLSLCLSLLERSLEKAVEIGGEWLYDTVLTGAAAEAAYARVVSQLKLRMEQLFIQQGNEFASTRARAHYYVEGAADEACTGVSYYHFLCNLLEKADWSALGAKLDAVRRRVLQTAALTVSLHGTEAALEKLRTLLPESRFAAAAARASANVPGDVFRHLNRIKK